MYKLLSSQTLGIRKCPSKRRIRRPKSFFPPDFQTCVLQWRRKRRKRRRRILQTRRRKEKKEERERRMKKNLAEPTVRFFTNQQRTFSYILTKKVWTNEYALLFPIWDFSFPPFLFHAKAVKHFLPLSFFLGNPSECPWNETPLSPPRLLSPCATGYSGEEKEEEEDWGEGECLSHTHSLKSKAIIGPWPIRKNIRVFAVSLISFSKLISPAVPFLKGKWQD